MRPASIQAAAAAAAAASSPAASPSHGAEAAKPKRRKPETPWPSALASTPVRMERRLAGLVKAIAKARGISTTDYLSTLNRQISRDYAEVMRELRDAR